MRKLFAICAEQASADPVNRDVVGKFAVSQMCILGQLHFLLCLNYNFSNHFGCCTKHFLLAVTRFLTEAIKGEKVYSGSLFEEAGHYGREGLVAEAWCSSSGHTAR